MAGIPSGTVSLETISTVYGGSRPDSISEYYRGGSNVPSLTSTSSIPTSGRIRFSDFWNTGTAQSWNMGRLPNMSFDTNADSTRFGYSMPADNDWKQLGSTNTYALTFTAPTPDYATSIRLRSTTYSAFIGGGISYYSDAYSDWSRSDQIRDPGLTIHKGTYGSATQSSTDTANLVKRVGAGNDKIVVGTAGKSFTVPAMSNVAITPGSKYTARYSCEFYRAGGSYSSPGWFSFQSSSRPYIYVDSI
jgi:hypothetical protein